MSGRSGTRNRSRDRRRSVDRRGQVVAVVALAVAVVLAGVAPAGVAALVDTGAASGPDAVDAGATDGVGHAAGAAAVDDGTVGAADATAGAVEVSARADGVEADAPPRDAVDAPTRGAVAAPVGGVARAGGEAGVRSARSGPDPAATLSGAAFALPESLSEEVKAVRGSLPGPVPDRAFVLATAQRVYVVLTDRRPVEGTATVDGLVLDSPIRVDGFEFGVVVASSASFSQSGTPTNLSEIVADPAAYDRELVRVEASTRYLTARGDPDAGAAGPAGDPSAPVAAGYLTDDPLDRGVLREVGNRTLRAVREASGAPNRSVLRAILNETLGNASRLATVSVGDERAFWTGAPAVTDGVVLAPGTPAREYLRWLVPANLSETNATDRPLLYVVDQRLPARSVDGPGAVRNRSGELDGEVVSLTASLAQRRVSVQEFAEHEDGACTDRRLLVPTGSGADCVNVAVDVLLHGGVAYAATGGGDGAPGPAEVLPVVAASNREQDRPTANLTGQYRIRGRVLDLDPNASDSELNRSALADRLPEAVLDRLNGTNATAVLVAYELNRTGDAAGPRPAAADRTLDAMGGAVEDGADAALGAATPDPAARFDADGDDRIDAREVLAAVAAFNAGDRVGNAPVEASDVLDVLAAYEADRAV